MIQVSTMMEQQMTLQIAPMSNQPCIEWQMSKGRSTTMLKLASQVKQTKILTTGETWGSAYWWMRQATQRRAAIICTTIMRMNICLIFKISDMAEAYRQCYNLPSSMHHHHYTKSDNVEALSIYHTQERQKKGTAGGSRKHLLGLLSSFTKEEVDVKCEEVEELCCFDRMKKVIAGREGGEDAERKDQVSSILIEQKINQLENQMQKMVHCKPSTPKLHHQRSNSSNNFRKQTLNIEDFKHNCLTKYIGHQVAKRQKDFEEVRRVVDRQVNSQIDHLVEDKGLRLIKYKEQNQELRKQILELHLQIEGLRGKQNQMEETIEELKELTKGRAETKKFVAKNSDEKFQEQFRDFFGDISLEQLKYKLDVAVGKCLDSFEKVENRNMQKMQDQKKTFEGQCERMQKKISKLQKNEDDLLSNLKTLKLNNQLSQIEQSQLAKAKVDLARLQKLILALFTQWHAQRGDNEKKLLKTMGGLSENYSYEEMVRYIVDYGRKYSTNQKLNDYLFKILRGIQKLRRTIYPEQCNQKLDPLATLSKIQKWVKLRAQVPTQLKKQASTFSSHFRQQ